MDPSGTAQSYTLSVLNGSGSGTYTAETLVTVTASTPSGQSLLGLDRRHGAERQRRVDRAHHACGEHQHHGEFLRPRHVPAERWERCGKRHLPRPECGRRDFGRYGAQWTNVYELDGRDGTKRRRCLYPQLTMPASSATVTATYHDDGCHQIRPECGERDRERKLRLGNGNHHHRQRGAFRPDVFELDRGGRAEFHRVADHPHHACVEHHGYGELSDDSPHQIHLECSERRRERQLRGGNGRNDFGQRGTGGRHLPQLDGSYRAERDGFHDYAHHARIEHHGDGELSRRQPPQCTP